MCRRFVGLTIGLFILVLSLGVPVAIVGAQTKELIFDLKVERGTVPAKMQLIRVKQGDVVKLRWSSDRPITLHLHGYDIERKIVPGTVAEMAFTADATGRFPVEEHKLDAHGGSSHGQAPLVRIEVYPR
jgi:hypothetical protein